LLLHVLDLDPATGRDPVDDLRVVNAELGAYSERLAGRPQIIIGNKVDLPETELRRRAVEAVCAGAGLPFVAISAATGAGLGELRARVAEALEEIGWVPLTG
jgi:GTP-binding protein